MLNIILFLVFLVQTKTTDCDSSVSAILDYVPSSQTLEGVNDNLKSVSSILTIRPMIAVVQMLEALRKSEKFKDDTIGKVDDAKDQVVDTANDAKEGVQDAGKKVKNVFG